MTTFNLTTEPDNLSGGSSNDTFIATYNDGMTGTFSIGDALNGNAGIDTLDITPLGVAAIAPPDTLWTNVSNIEKIVINPTGEGAQTITTGAAFQAAFAAAGIGLKTTSGAGAITTDMSSFTGEIALTTISDAGAQTLTTGAGLATILATSTAGAQTITTGTGLATVMATSTAGAQTIAGANLTNVKIASTAGGQTITSNGAAAVTVEAISTAGVQTITTGAGSDVITATTTAANNIINAGAGNDTVTILASATGNYTIHGNEDNDTITGGTGIDTLYGDIGNDILSGFNPNSSTLGQGTIDNFNGGAGSDRFVLGDSNWIGYDDGSNTSAGVADYANIADFKSSENDVIQLRGASTDYLLATVGADTQILINKAGAEPDELIGVIRNQAGLSLTGAYFDYKKPPVFAIASAAANEGSAITFSVTRTGDTQAAQAVTVATSIGANNTASANDFTANTGTLSFASGETVKTFTVQTIQDNFLEGNETFAVSLTNPSNGAILSATNSNATGTINNNDFGVRWNLDVDGDGKVGALSDGVMLMRYLLGGSVFSGDALINGAISATATRNVTQIRSYLEQGVLQKDLDIDGNGSVTALSDGLIAQRYLFGATFSGNALIAGAIAPDATRDLAGIQSYMAGLTNLT
jgi:hypothetical protein